MKRLIISMALVAASLCLAVFSFFDVRKTAERLTVQIDSAAEAISRNDYSSARTVLEQCRREWNESRGRLELYLYSEELFGIDAGLDKAQKLADTDDVSELVSVLYEIRDEVRRMTENQTPSLKKIF